MIIKETQHIALQMAKNFPNDNKWSSSSTKTTTHNNYNTTPTNQIIVDPRSSQRFVYSCDANAPRVYWFEKPQLSQNTPSKKAAQKNPTKNTQPIVFSEYYSGHKINVGAPYILIG